MITLICGTNRPDSYTDKVAAFYSRRMDLKKVDHCLFSLTDIPQGMINNDMYNDNRPPEMNRIQEEVLIPASKYIIVIPEYNGSFPGILKAFIDCSDIAACWHNKKACLVGVSSGRAGNLRGMDDLTNVLNHMRISVLHQKIPVTGVSSILDEEGRITSPETIDLIDKQIDLLLNF